MPKPKLCLFLSPMSQTRSTHRCYSLANSISIGEVPQFRDTDPLAVHPHSPASAAAYGLLVLPFKVHTEPTCPSPSLLSPGQAITGSWIG